MEIYKHPIYYEIAFSFFDPKKQVEESTWHVDKPLEKAEKLTNINMALLRRKIS